MGEGRGAIAPALTDRRCKRSVGGAFVSYDGVVMRLGLRGKSFGSLLFDAEVVLCMAGGVVVGVVLGTGGN